MAKLAFAIDGSIDIWDLAHGYGVDQALALAMSSHLGEDALIYRIAEMQGGYFGLARLVSITALAGTGAEQTVEFTDIRVFTAEIPYPVGVTTLTRLQLLDDKEFNAIVESGTPASVPIGMMEPRRPFLYDTPSYAEVGSVLEMVRNQAKGICALTGEDVGAALQLAVIWPKGARAGLQGDNFLPLAPGAYEAFESGQFSARDDLSVLLDMSRMDRGLSRRVHPSGALVVSDNPALRPAAENLAYHRRVRFRLS
jgi:hypothetical protein